MPGEPIRVLLVDDHPVVRDGVAMVLNSAEGIAVTGTAECAAEAITLVRQQPFDVALVDIALPDRNGLDLVKHLLAQQPALRVIMLSMYSEEIYAIRALRAGAVGYLTKDSRPATLVAAVRKVACGGKYLNPEMIDQLATEVASGDKRAHAVLSDRELEVLRLLASGHSQNAIASLLNVSAKTIATYRSRIVEKTGLTSTAELTRYALESGLVL
jgi:DNA-binding NarL/FixJ family response regulator